MAKHGDMRDLAPQGSTWRAGRLRTIMGSCRACHRLRPLLRHRTIPIAGSTSEASCRDLSRRRKSGTTSVHTVSISVHTDWSLGEVPGTCEFETSLWLEPYASRLERRIEVVHDSGTNLPRSIFCAVRVNLTVGVES